MATKEMRRRDLSFFSIFFLITKGTSILLIKCEYIYISKKKAKKNKIKCIKNSKKKWLTELKHTIWLKANNNVDSVNRVPLGVGVGAIQTQ